MGRPGLGGGLCVFLFGLYVATLAPGLNWADGARLQLEAAIGGSHYLFLKELAAIGADGLPFDRLGIAPWDHPLYVVLGHALFRLAGDRGAYALNLASAVAASAALYLVYRITVELVGRTGPALCAALALGLSHTFWFHAVTTEVYALHTLIMTSVILLSLRWRRYRKVSDLTALCFLAGLGIANHVMMVLTILPMTAFLVHVTRARPADDLNPARTVGPRQGWLLLGALALGAAPWWIQFARMARIFGPAVVVESAAWFPGLPRLFLAQAGPPLGENLLEYAGWLLYQFGPLGLMLGAHGFRRLQAMRSPEALLLGALYLGHVAFSANYAVADRFAFHQPSHVIFAVAIGVGVAGLGAFPNGSRLCVPLVLTALFTTPVLVYAFTPVALRGLGLGDQAVGVDSIGTGARDGISYFLVPWKGAEDSATRFGRSTLLGLPRNALVLAPRTADREAYLVLRYHQVVEGIRPDVELELMVFEPAELIRGELLRRARADAHCRPVYLASRNRGVYPLTEMRREFDLVPEANLFRLLPKALAAAEGCAAPPRDRGMGVVDLIRSALR